MQIAGNNVVDLGKRTFKEVSADDVSGLSAELAYRFFLAIFPFFILIAALGGFVAHWMHVANPTDRIINALGSSLPADATSVLRGQLQTVIESRNGGILSAGIVGTVLAASAGMNSLIKAMNRVHDVAENRPFVKKYAAIFGLTVLAGAFIVLAFAVMFAGQVFGQQIADKLGGQGAYTELIRFGRWPVAVVLLVVAVAFLYWAAPAIRMPFRLITPGALLFTAVWLLATYLFSLYVAHFSSYNKTYGALAGVVVLMIWFYLTAFILLLGAEVNAVIDQQMQPEHARRSGLEAGGQAPPKPPVPAHRPPRPAATAEPPAMAPAAAGETNGRGPGAAQRPGAWRTSRIVGGGGTTLGALVAGLAIWRAIRAEPRAEDGGRTQSNQSTVDAGDGVRRRSNAAR